MDFSLPRINNIDNIVPLDNLQGTNISEKAATEQLTSIFLKNMLKEIYKNQTQNSLFGDNSNSSLVSDSFVDQIVSQIAATDALGLNKLISSQAEKDKATKILSSYHNL